MNKKEKIMSWDKQNIYELRDLINELSERERKVFDFSDLPTRDFDSDMAGYPVWAMDINGRCLVGIGHDLEVQTVNEVAENQRD